MAAIEKLDTHHKALTLNLDQSAFGSFAEIGAGQEVARWFLIVGGASGTVAKTISAYDKEVSDDLYGTGSRYVSRQRLEAMLDREWTQLLNQLAESRGSRTRFFSFVDTVSARNYAGTNEPHGWLGLRFQQQPGGQPNDILLHINLRDPSNLLQQEATGILGVNLIYAAFYQLQTEHFLESLVQDVENRIEIDYVDLRGPAFETWDQRALLVQLVCRGFAQAVCFPSSGSPVPPTEVIHRNPVVLAPGYFVHMDPSHAEIHTRMLASGIRQLQREMGETKTTPKGFFCLTLAPSDAKEPPPGVPDLLHRIDALRSHGGDVLLFREPELYTMTDFVNRYTEELVRFVVGLSVVIRAFEDRYSKLGGGFLEALSRLLAQNVRIYAYPMISADLKETVQRISTTDWKWDDTNGWVSARQLRLAPPRGYLYAYVLDSNFLVPIQEA
jgi:hypothetical protein